MSGLRPDWVQAVRQARPTLPLAPSTCIVVDPGLVDHPIVALARHQLGHLTRRISVHPCDVGPGSSPVEALADVVADHELVVSVGGGSVMDLCCLARLVAADPTNLRRLRFAGRSGVVQLSGQVGQTAVVCVPTTIGTGAERAGVAVWDSGNARHLVTSPALRADAAVYDPLATASLSPDAIARGGLEVLLRLAGTYVAAASPELPQDAVAEALTIEAADRLYRLTATAGDARPESETDRLIMARVSAASHSASLVRSVQHIPIVWILTNETATELALAKMSVVPAIVPAVWDRILAGDTRFGHGHRLVRWWNCFRSAWPEPLPDEADCGIAELTRGLNIGATLPLNDTVKEAVAHRVMRAWSIGLPYASDLHLEDVVNVLKMVTTYDSTRKEVNNERSIFAGA